MFGTLEKLLYLCNRKKGERVAPIEQPKAKRKGYERAEHIRNS